MPLSDDLHRLRSDLDPASGAYDRVRGRLMRRIDAPAILQDARQALEPSAPLRARIWHRITPTLAATTAPVRLLDQIHALLSPSSTASQRVWRRLRPSLTPEPASIRGGGFLKWTAAFAVFALAVRISPLLFLAPPTIADSRVDFLITRGEAAVSIGGLWQPVSGGLPLEPGMMLRTHEGEASIVFHDDGVIRLAPGTTVTLHDTADRREPAPEVLPVLTLHTGRIWVQGLIPGHVRGLTIATSHGHITVHEGSVLIGEEDDGVVTEVFNRRAVVMRDGEETVLVHGERTRLWEGNALLVTQIPAETEDDAWIKQNLARDAVHRREIAQMQQERRAARAGILPTSRLYSVKRVAERVDVLMTFGEEARVQKQINNASVRLAEAAALMEEGKMEEVAQPLQEYRDALAVVASGSGAGSVAKFLLQQAVSETTADMAASLPGDDSYLLKRAVLEASASLPDGILSDQAVRGEILIDTLAAMSDATEQGTFDQFTDVLPSMEDAVALLDDTDSDITPEVRKEAQAALSRLAVALADQAPSGTGADAALLEAVSSYLPPEPTPTVPPLTDEEVQEIVQHIWDRIYVFSMSQSRKNQLVLEIGSIKGHREEGRILRALYQEIPRGSDLNELVRKAIVDLRWRAASVAN